MPAAKQGSGSTSHRLFYSDESGNECRCAARLRWGEWVWPRAAPCQSTASRCVAEMSSRTDGPEQITNNAERYKIAETHCWRWLIRQTEIWGTTTAKKKKKKGGEEGGRARWDTEGSEQEHQVQDTKICFLLCTEKLLLRMKSITFLLIHTSCRGGGRRLDRGKPSAGGKVNRLSLLYSSHFIHLVGLIKCQVEFLDI